MGFTAFAAPILPGKTEQLKRFTEELNGPRNQEYVESRKRAGVLERTFLQQTPQGDFALVTLEGNDPLKSFEEFAKSQDPFARWFNQQVKEIHGIDLAQISSMPAPALVVQGGISHGTSGGREEEDKKIVRRFVDECINQQKESSWNELTAPNYRNYGFGSPLDRDATIQLVRQFHQGFPDLHVALDEVIIDGDRAASKDTITGTHKGVFQGIPATGRHVTVRAVTYYRIEKGRIVEDFPSIDMMSIMQQLGVTPVQQRRAA